MRPRSVVLLTVAVLLATAGFGIGAALEKATAGERPSATNHTESSEALAGSETPAETAATSETVLGINPESVPLIAGAIVGSLALAVGIWLYWRLRAVLWLAAGLMAAFGALDLIEVVHQLSAKHLALVLVAGVVAILHGAAAVLAIRLVLGRVALESAPARSRGE